MKVNRVALKYKARNAAVVNDPANAFVQVKVGLQGRDFRPPRDDSSLFDIHHELTHRGFHRHTTEQKTNGRRGNGYASTWLEYWALQRPPLPPLEQPPLQTQVEYNRAKRVYHVMGGIIPAVLATCPDATTAGWTQIRLHDPDLHQFALGMLDRYPDVENRALQAARLIALDHVHRAGQPHLYHVRSLGTAGRVYRAAIPPDARDNWTCTVSEDTDPAHHGDTCPDCRYRAPNLGHGPRCSHMLAAFILSRIADYRAKLAGDGPKAQGHRWPAARYLDGTPVDTPEKARDFAEHVRITGHPPITN